MGINTKATLSDSAVELMDKAVIISGATHNKVDNYITTKFDNMAAAIGFTIFSKMAKATTPLVDGTPATSITMDDTKIVLTPAEHGAVVTSTALANLATAGKADLAAAELVGINLGETTDQLGINALESGTNGTTAAVANTLATGDLRLAYEFLSGKSIPKFADGRYVAFMNPTQISDIKDDFITIMQNTDGSKAVNGLVGALEGFTIIEDANVTDGTVACFGYNALGKAIAKTEAMVITDGNESLKRSMNVGWYGVVQYGIVDNNALYVITSA